MTQGGANAPPPPPLKYSPAKVALFELLVWPHEVESWFHSWYRGSVDTLSRF